MSDDARSDEKRFNETLKRMLDTPPKPKKAEPKPEPPQGKKKAISSDE